MNAIQVQIGNLPLVLQCFSNGLVSILRMADFKTIIDQDENKTTAMFDNSGFKIGEESYNYGEAIEYKHNTEVLTWLQKQGLTSPF